ncbi:MAG: ROK family protein [Planctomycetota bacterium]
MSAAFSRTSDSIGSQGSPSRGVSLGIDLGGTTIKFGLFRGDRLLARDFLHTLSFESPALAFTEIRTWIQRVLGDAADATHHALIDSVDDIDSIGLAMPGVLMGGGKLAETANLHQWRGVDFGEELADVFKQQPVVINDANAAAMGEFSFAKLDPASNLIFLTLGTGVGGGVIVGGRPVDGEHRCGGEIGHAVVDHSPSARRCGCGFPGHLEAYAGSAGIVRTMHEVIQEDGVVVSGPRLHRASQVQSPADVATLAEEHDVAALETIRRTGMYLGRAIAAAATVTNPREFVLGGAIDFGGRDTLAGEQFLTAIHEEVRRISLREVSEHLVVRFSALGGQAGLYGAAYYAGLHP